MDAPASRIATLYRIVRTDHLCPSGLKAKDLLQRQGFRVNDRWLTTREQVEAFKVEHAVKTTPQVFVDKTRIGGYEDLRRYLGLRVAASNSSTYRPVLAVFAVAALLAAAASYAAFATALSSRTVEWFIAFSMCLLAMLKLQDVERFTGTFLGYDLLARRWVPYAYFYAYAELLAGVLMTAHVLTWLSAPVAFVIGSIGAVSVLKAVYIDHRELRCACVGGDSRVPLGAISLTENLLMVGMAIQMAAMVR